METSQIALLIVAGFFVGYLLLQVRPLFSPKRRALLSEVRSSRKRALDATTDHDRAAALMAGGRAAAQAKRYTSAAGLFLRALRLDPASVELVETAAASLAPRPRLGRTLFERRLAALTAEGVRGPAYVALVKALADVYRKNPRWRGLAAVMDRLGEHEAAAEKGP